MFFKKSGGASWLIVFLGNPGKEYENTRHNAGFLAADAMEKRLGVKINKLKFHALTALCRVGDEGVLLLKPQTYMNLSGQAVGEAARFYKIPSGKIIVLSDEAALPLGRIRVRRSGSAGGHNGLKDIIAALGSEDFPRIRLGVGGKPHEDYDMRDWVLSRFTGRDAELISDAAERAAEAALCYIEKGPDEAMNRYNQK
ncbi:MAG: aminoacyl-tRNA hydrolase [Oscillospiraceae bacterium]|nr:aminoacyl-tRNA hydrolase [Oscillospiraceae bacterium]